MTTRDSRRDPRRPGSQGGGGRDPTQSLEVELVDDLEEPAQPEELARGTHDHTKAESPAGRAKPISRPPSGERHAPTLHTEDPHAYLGTTLGTYRIDELLGKGGMGYVYRAEHVKLGREVALKLLRADYSRRRDSVARFFQEARTVNRVRHRNIVDVTDFVELEDGTTFIIMELLSGISLGKWARSGVDLPRALAVLVQICDGLSAAHAVGVVHRDLKPDNVVVIPTSDGAELVKLLDFGVAKLLNRDDEDIGFQTAAGSVIGTPAYMSPEQAGGMPLDHRGDIYSLGAIMYELFCGQPMFRGRSFGEYVRKHLTEQPVPPRQTPMGAGIDPRLEALILKCLDKEPSLRFSTILELRDGLLQLLGGLETAPPGFASMTSSGILLSPLPVAPMQQMPTPISQLSQLHPSAINYSHHSSIVSRPPEAPTPWWVWLSGGMFAVAVGIAAALWYAGRSDDKPVVATKTPTTAPSVAAIAPIEPAVTRPSMIEVRFDSLPEGHVFAEGRSAELCKTPCAFDIDATNGGGDKRTFVVKSEGYKDGSVVVDLTGSRREFHVSLEALVVDTTPDPTPVSPAVTKDDKPVRPIQRRPIAKKSGSSASPTASATKDDKAPPQPDKKPVGDDRLMKPDDDKPASTTPDIKPVKKPGNDTIDPAETLDPFHRKK